MKGRFRKAKKAYKKGNGCVPLWWTGSPRQQNLQARYFWFTLLKEWEGKSAALNVQYALSAAMSAVQTARINGTPKQVDQTLDDYLRQKSRAVIELVDNLVEQHRRISSQMSPRPRLIDYIKPAFTT